MKLTVEMDQAQLDELKDRLAFINGGWERAVVRAMNTAASQARTRTAERARALLTADRQRIEDSLLVKKATYGARAARLHIYDQPIPLFRFDVSFMYPTVEGGVTARTFQGEAPLTLKHAFVAKMATGHVGVFSRRGKERLPIQEHYGPTVATVFEKTPGLEAEIMQLAAEKFAQEAARQAAYLIQKELGQGDEG